MSVLSYLEARNDILPALILDLCTRRAITFHFADSKNFIPLILKSTLTLLQIFSNLASLHKILPKQATLIPWYL